MMQTFESMDKVVLFCRVSTCVQDYQRQVSDLTQLAASRGWEVANAFCEQVSGAAAKSKRTELLAMMDYIAVNDVKRVLVTELSRLGRDTLQVLEVIRQLTERGVSLYIQNYNIETLTPDGKVNAMSQFLITILAEVARMERGSIRERMESGYQCHRANGGKVGRKPGYKKTDTRMLEEYAEEVRLLKKGISLRNVSKLTGTSVNTLRKCKVLVM